MNYQALFLDIDGTILKPDHSYSDATKNAIKQVQQKGLEVFLATGRPLHEITDLAKQLNIKSFIGYNGGYAIFQNEVIVNDPMDKEVIETYIAISRTNKHEIVFYTNEKNYFTSLNSPVVKHFIESFKLKYNELYTDEVKSRILGITVMNLETDHAQLYEINRNIHLAQVNIEGLKHSYDVIRSNVNKGKAIERIMQHLKLTKQQTIAFGDGMNDKEMLATVGEGFAMGNAHPDLFAYAKHKTNSVYEDGIFKGLKKLGLVE